jgi:hypothetical protein
MSLEPQTRLSKMLQVEWTLARGPGTRLLVAPRLHVSEGIYLHAADNSITAPTRIKRRVPVSRECSKWPPSAWTKAYDSASEAPRDTPSMKNQGDGMQHLNGSGYQRLQKKTRDRHCPSISPNYCTSDPPRLLFRSPHLRRSHSTCIMLLYLPQRTPARISWLIPHLLSPARLCCRPATPARLTVNQVSSKGRQLAGFHQCGQGGIPERAVHTLGCFSCVRKSLASP